MNSPCTANWASLALVLVFALSPASAASQWLDLFARADLTQWVEEHHDRVKTERPDLKSWELVDGVLRCEGSAGNVGFLRYPEPLGDFELIVEFRAAPGTNSGITFRAPPYNGRHTPAHTGYELQIMDDAGRPTGVSSSGAFYSIGPPKVNAIRPAGEWNTVRILCEGPRITAELNGEVVQDFNQEEVTEASDRPLSGYLSFQNHGGNIEFRNARLREIASPAPGIVTFNDDGGWCWFEDERAIVHDGKIIIGSVASGYRDRARKGNIEATTYELATGKKHVSVLHRNLELDDHDSPAFLVRPDGRLLTLYAKHGPESHFYYRISTAPNDASRWQPERSFTPTESSRITYSNLYFLSAENDGEGRVYDFYRGLDNSFKPSYAYSDDRGESWNSGNVFIDVPTQVRHRPYVKYASNGADTIHVFYTDGHPRNFDNSVYHVFYREGDLHDSGGDRISSLREGLRDPSDGTLVFAGDPDNVAWVVDLHLDGSGRPVGVFSVQKDSAGLPRGQGGDDHRYHYARWTGEKWETHEIGYAGTRLYPIEDDYTGGIALDPDDTSIIYFSTNADPATGAPLLSTSDGQRHYEIFKGVTADGGSSWSFTPITENSATDNLRPIVPKWSRDRTALLWLRGTYRSYTDYSLEIVGQISD